MENNTGRTESFDKEYVIEKLREIAGDPEQVLADVPMKEYTTFKIGGPADILFRPSCSGQVRDALAMLKNLDVPYFILGNGSDILVRDGGFRGVMLHIGKAMSDIKIEGTEVTAGAGALLSTVAGTASRAGLTGMEFASGIPGSIGGALFMNAGAYDGEISFVVKSAEVLTREGEIRTMQADEMELGYRHSVFMENGAVILSAVFGLEKGDRDAIDEKIRDFTGRRTSKQPLDLPSAGSTFKRPEGYFAGKLIQDAGCKGLSVGRAQVSPKHSGFVVNNGGATAAEVIDLINLVQLRVKEDFGVELETEVRIIGEE